MDTVRNNKVMKRQRENYRKDFEYAEGIAFEDVCDTVVGLMEEIIVETPQNHVNLVLCQDLVQNKMRGFAS